LVGTPDRVPGLREQLLQFAGLGFRLVEDVLGRQRDLRLGDYLVEGKLDVLVVDAQLDLLRRGRWLVSGFARISRRGFRLSSSHRLSALEGPWPERPRPMARHLSLPRESNWMHSVREASG
jgi:hypothetical protein